MVVDFVAIEAGAGEPSDRCDGVIAAHLPAHVVLHVRPQHLDGLGLTLVRRSVDKLPAFSIERLLKESTIEARMLQEVGLHPRFHLIHSGRILARRLKE